jgi:hypothetical protein
VSVWTGAVLAGGKPDPRDIVAKGMKAAGGEANVSMYKAIALKEEGTYYGMGQGLPYKGTYAIQYPNQFRMEIENVFTIVVNGDKGWLKAEGDVKELTREQLAEQKEQMYAGWVAQLWPLKDKAFTLKGLGQVKVGKGPAETVLVSSKGHRDVFLYFDTKSGLLVKTQTQVKAQEQGGKEMKQETFYSGFQEVQGVKVPTKALIKRDGQVFVDATASDIRLMKRLDSKIFAQP